MSNIKLATDTAEAMVDAAVDLIDGGASAGVIEIRSGTQPTTGDDAATGTLLATLTFSDPAFGAAGATTPATAIASAITSDTDADNTGVATWFRVKDSNGTKIFDGDVTATGGGGDLTLDSTSIVSGGTVTVTSFTFKQPRYSGDT